MSDRLVEDGREDSTVPRCRVCGTLVGLYDLTCPRCSSPLAPPPSTGDSLEATWVVAPPTAGRTTIGSTSIRRTTALIVGCVVLALAVTVGGFLLAGGGGTTPAPLPTATGSVASGPSTPAEPPSSSGPASLPRSAAISTSQFVVPRGGPDDQRLYLADIEGSPQLELATPAGHHVNSPTLSTDRQSLIYIDRTDDSMRTIAVDGSGDKTLLDNLEGCETITHVTWSPVDQTQLVVRCAGSDASSKLLVYTLDGEVVRELSPPHLRFDDPALAPDGVSLAYWASDEEGRGGGALYVLPIDGSGIERRLTDPGTAKDADPAWSPDGSQLAFTRRSDSSDSDVYAVSATGGSARAVMAGPGVDQKPAWSPDGSSLLVVSNRAADGGVGRRLNLYLVGVDDEEIERLDIGDRVLSTPVWSRR